MNRKAASTTNISNRKGSKVTTSASPKGCAKGTTSSRREATTAPRSQTPKKSNILARTPSTSSARPNGKTHTSSPTVSSLKAFSPPTHILAPATASPPIPNYRSAIHRPSTNPSFTIDPRSKHEFAEWTDLSGEKLKVEVWGKVGLYWHGVEDAYGAVKNKGKQKEKELSESESDTEWKVLEEWIINLADLVLLPEDVSLL
jgi:UV radiation resistance-associated gene protein